MAYLLIQTLFNAERIAEASLTAPYRGCHVYFPKIKVRRAHAGKVELVERPFIPRYAFVDDSQGYNAIRNAPGVSSVSRYPSRSVERAMDEIRRREVGGFVQLAQPLADGTDDFTPNDAVRIAKGPMFGLIGVFDAHVGMDRARIFLQWLGSVELKISQLERA